MYLLFIACSTQSPPSTTVAPSALAPVTVTAEESREDYDAQMGFAPDEVGGAEVAVVPGGRRGTREGAGGPPTGGGGPGAGGNASAVTITYNNGRGVVRTGDGQIHMVYVDHDAGVYQRGTAAGALEPAPSPLPPRVGSVSIESDGERALGLTWTAGRPGAVYGSISTDGGKSWSAATALAGGVEPGTQPNLRLWTSGGITRAVAVWHEGPRGGPSTVLSASWDGKVWLPPVAVSTGAAESSFPSVGGTGDLSVVVWRDSRNGAGKELFIAERTGTAGAFAKERGLGVRGQDPSICVTSNGTINLAYQAAMSVWFSRSTNRGVSFGDPVQLDPNGLFGRVLCDEKGRVGVVWEDIAAGGTMRDDELKTVGFAVSTDGVAFRDIRPLGGLNRQVFPTAAMNPDGSIDLAWVDKATGTPKVQTWNAW